MKKGDQNLDPGRYQLVPRTLCFVLCGDKVLLLQGAPNKRLWANRYNGVGGHVHRGEDIATAARREIREETGLEVDHLRLTGLVTVDVDSQAGVGLYVFVAQAKDYRVSPSDEGELEWFALDRLPWDRMVDDLPQLMDRILAPNDTGVPFFAHYSYDPQDGELIITFGS